MGGEGWEIFVTPPATPSPPVPHMHSFRTEVSSKVPSELRGRAALGWLAHGWREHQKVIPIPVKKANKCAAAVWGKLREGFGGATAFTTGCGERAARTGCEGVSLRPAGV